MCVCVCVGKQGFGTGLQLPLHCIGYMMKTSKPGSAAPPVDVRLSPVVMGRV